METITNNEKAFPKIVKFCKAYFTDVKVIGIEYSHLAGKSQNYHKTIQFKNRGIAYSIDWNYYNCTLRIGNNTKKKAALYFTFYKMRFDDCYPIEVMNNSNIMFWEYDVVDRAGQLTAISPMRKPVTLK